MLPNLMTVKEAARQLKVCERTVWRWIKDGKLKSYRVGVRAIRVREDDLKQFLKAGESK